MFYVLAFSQEEAIRGIKVLAQFRTFEEAMERKQREGPTRLQIFAVAVIPLETKRLNDTDPPLPDF